MEGGITFSNSRASGLSASTGDLVHKQVKPQRQEYKLSRLSGIQVQPLTNTLTCEIPIPEHSRASTVCRADALGDQAARRLRKRGQPTWESQREKAERRSEKGELGVVVRVGETGRGVEREGNSRKWERRRRVRAKAIIGAA